MSETSISDLVREGVLQFKAAAPGERITILDALHFRALVNLLQNNELSGPEVEHLTSHPETLVRAYSAIRTVELSTQLRLLEDSSTLVATMVLLNESLTSEVHKAASFSKHYSVRSSLAALEEVKITEEFSARWIQENKPKRFKKLTQRSKVDPQVAKMLVAQWEGSLGSLLESAKTLSAG